MIDIHVHTNFSDGSEDVLYVLKMAEEKGLEYLSITDHETCKAYEYLENIDINKYYTGKLIRGVELKTIVKDIPIELLGYGVDYNVINQYTPKMYITKEQKNKKELEELSKICEKLGIFESEKIIKEYNKDKYTYASSYVHEIIKQNKENRKFFTCDETWNDPMDFYRKEMCNKESMFYINSLSFTPKIDEVIDLIKKANGLVFVPHVYVYGENSGKVFEYLTKNYLDKIDGFECFYSKFTNAQSEFLVDYCKKNNLFISGGSDYHGKIKPTIFLGEGINNNLNIDCSIIKPWVKEEYLYN